MHVTTNVFWIPKDGNSAEEYEDAFWPEAQDCEKAIFLAAIADGATESSFSRFWAKLLVRSFCAGIFTGREIWEALPRLQRHWLKSVSQKSLPWYAEEKLKVGAFSTVVGLTLYDPTGAEFVQARWAAIAVGDSCLFQVREGELIKAWPLDKSDQFNSRPFLLSSISEDNAELDGQTEKVSDTWQPQDTFYLMTDALACWFLRSIEEGRKLTDIIPDFENSSLTMSFPDWIAERRTSGLLRNDDVTLIRMLIR
jgi:Protein phosphatase 2C